MSSLFGASPRSGSMQSTNTGKIPGHDVHQISRFTPEMMQLFNQMFSQVSPDSYTGRLAGGDDSIFGEIEAPAFRQFGELQGNMSSRFSGMGMGARRSSGFQNTMNQAASELSQNLQSQRHGLRRQAIQDLSGMSNELLRQRPFENVVMPKEKTFLQKILGGLGPLANDPQKLQEYVKLAMMFM